MESLLLHAMNVLSQCADLATSMREEREISPVRSVKPDINASKVSCLCIFIAFLISFSYYYEKTD